ncbi:MAG: hypothetical protein WCH99_04325 [Verrucomicrobiota bacterium]
MKKTLILAAALTTGLTALAALPIYNTKSANGNAAAPATVIFPADPATQIRVVGVNYTTDTNNSVLAFSGGSTAFSIVETNQATSSVTNKINSTNGLAGSAVLVLQHGGVCYAATVSAWNSSTNAGFYGGTNVVLTSGGWGVRTSAGDSVYLMDTPITIPAASSTMIGGEAIYAATLPGRPVMAQLTPALVTNKLNNVTVRYE